MQLLLNKTKGKIQTGIFEFLKGDPGYYSKFVDDYLTRIDTAGADEITTQGRSDLTKIIRHLVNNGLFFDTELLYLSNAGKIQRLDGILKYIRTAYDGARTPNDLDGSETASQQPRLVGGIAPGSKPAAANQSGESRSFSHPSITVTGTYTVVKAINSTGKLEVSYTEVTSGTLSTVTWEGTLRLYMIYAGTLSTEQRSQLEAKVYAIYPEIESVDIGTQAWATRNFEAVATPMGNVIANVTDNADWANATNLYNAAYAAHVGTTEEKEYAGLKAAAMWCYYNNDPDNGAIYGKLYNWYAAKLLDLDMQSAGFGWRVPTSADFTTLANYLGGASVAGGKMKVAGTDYWNSPNTGDDNSSGFTALGGGRRNAAGLFSNIKIRMFIINSQTFNGISVSNTETNISDWNTYIGTDPINGGSIRLIKE